MRAKEFIQEIYTEDNGALLRYMKAAEFDPYSHWYEICLWIEDHYLDEFIELSNTTNFEDVDPEIFYKLPIDIQKQCAETVIEDLMQNNPAEAPTWAHMELSNQKLLPRNTWLIHFTNYPCDIAKQGFTIGVDQMDKLGLTTWTKNTSIDKKHGGYNFAFIADSKEVVRSIGKYGKHAVLFQNSGIKAYHWGDEEEQTMFYGKDVDPKDIIVLINDDDNWQVRGSSKKQGEFMIVLYSGELNQCIKWIQKNYAQYRKYLSRK
jgi:hypothetical protein